MHRKDREDAKCLALTLDDWEHLPNGCIRGRVSDFGDTEYEIGDIVVTSPIVSEKVSSNRFVAVQSGKRYFLSRRIGKNSGAAVSCQRVVTDEIGGNGSNARRRNRNKEMRGYGVSRERVVSDELALVDGNISKASKSQKKEIEVERVASYERGGPRSVLMGSPTLVDWHENADGTITGEVKFSCERIMTPPVVRGLIGHGQLVESSGGFSFFLA
mmetsp:Transcript_49157/g.147965  ORF Transcript_49157/g.147965 Transcript_49157/m.147965 type:complete len:215 (+) Transcript_49157:433-1077(+)